MQSRFDKLSVPSRVAWAYALAGCSWIIVSDGVVALSMGESWAAWLTSSSKGLMFVICSALFIWWLLQRYERRSQGAAAALKAKDDRWRIALEVAGDGVWDWNGQTQKFFFSPRWKEMLGYGDHELATWDEWSERLHPEDRERVQALFGPTETPSRGTQECEYRLRAKSGSYRWILARGQVISRLPDGRPARAIGTHTDITARRESEERVTDALEFLQTILRAAPVGMLTYRVDGAAVSANEAAARLLGTTPEELLKQNFRQLDQWRENGLVACADQALRENHPVGLSARFAGLAGGRSAFCEVTFTAFRYEGEQRLLVILQDMTERRATLERMKVLLGALESAPAGWVVTDQRGVVEWVNPGFTKLTGYTIDEAMGRTMNFLKSGRHSANFYENLWQTILAGQVWSGELYNRRKDGSFYFERMTIAPVRNSEGLIDHFVSMKEDVTGQHEMERQLARSQRLESVGLLASGLAHDLNNMLAPIMLSVGLVKERHPDRETGELLDMVQKAAQRGAGVVQQILTFARGVEGQRVRVDVRPLMKEIAQLARETFPREIRVVVEVPRDPVYVDSDVTQMHQVLLNLAVNARDAMADGGVLTLKVATTELDEATTRRFPGVKAGAFVQLDIVDTGSGIAPEVIEHIFEPFYTTKPRGKGTGLGLSTVYGIVRSHGGAVDVVSQLGEGTRFSVLLPANTSPEVVATGAAEKKSAALEGAGRCVLVVDDEAAIRRVMTQLLSRRGFVTVEAEDGLKALQFLRASHRRFAIAIVDLMMPGMNGYKLVREIRTVAQGLPVVVASGMMGDLEAGQDMAALAALGVNTILKKPFAEAELLAALEQELTQPLLDGALQNKG